MSQMNEGQDRQLDENLRRAVRVLRLPPEATLEQVAGWKRAEPSHSAPQQRMSLRRRVRWFTAFVTTAAACVALYVMLVALPGPTVVEASTIVHRLRQNLFEGFQITLENIGNEGFRIDGRLILGYGVPPLDAPPGAPARHTESLYVEARLRANEYDEVQPFIDLESAAALRSDTQWAFFQLRGISESLLEKYPLAVPLVYLARQGILVELDGLGHLLRAIAERLPAGWVGPPDSPEPPRGPAPPIVAMNPQADIEYLLGSFLFGHADATQIDELICLMAQSARQVKVTSPTPGRHVLTARDFRPPGVAPDTPGAARLEPLELEIVYDEGVGIDGATIRNVGLFHGTIRLTPMSPRGHDELFDRQRFLRTGRTTVLKLSELDGLLERLLRDGFLAPHGE
ncbi:MAG: hypothetical protein HRF50_10465 [Phycisphaerae bacterium]|jgi:hypothetical protein